MARIRINFVTPIAFWGQKRIQPIILDSLLGYIKMRQLGYRKNPSEHFPEKIILPPLPFEKEGNPEYYLVSAMFTPPEAEWLRTYIYRRSDWESDMVRQVKDSMSTYKRESGTYRNMQEPFLLLTTPYIEFYCAVTDVDELVALLKSLKQIGFVSAKRSMGYGQIRNIELDLNAPWDMWRDGKPVRPVPVAEVGERDDLVKDYCGFRPPYWYTGNKALCYVPPLEQWCPRFPIRDAVSE